jgi:hypothetical protein
MKKLLTLLIALTLFTPLYGQSTDITQKPTSYWLSGNPDKDNAWNWMQEVDNNMFGNIGTGETYYVDSGVASAGGGQTMDTAVATLDAGINLCTANRGDRIYVAQGHKETGVVGTANMWTADVDGIQIIGLGQGSLTATFVYDYTSNTCVVTGNNITVHNLRFVPSTNAVAIGVNITGSYVNINNCDFGYPETATDEFADALYVGTSTGVIVENNFFDAGAQACTSALNFDDSDGLIIRGNRFYGDCSDAIIWNLVTLAEDILIEDNILWNGDSAALNTQPAFELLAGTVGISRRNYIATNLAMNTAQVGTLMFNFDNFYTEEQGGAKAAIAMAALVGGTQTHSVLITTDD